MEQLVALGEWCLYKSRDGTKQLGRKMTIDSCSRLENVRKIIEEQVEHLLSNNVQHNMCCTL